jgi:hypothetical protein
MNTNRLIKYLKNDLSELSEIFSELQPGSTLSSLEIKMILNRINAVNEEFELLENELNKDTETDKVVQTRKEKPKDNLQNKKEPIPQENTVDIIETSKEKKAEEELPSENLKEEITQAQEIEESEVEETAESITKDEIEQIELDEEPEVIEEEVVDTNEETIDEAITEQIEEEKHINEIEAEPQQTIADKYQGSTSSLNDHIAKHIEQKDLASKLQQNPIDDLTKAIKLNDKIWYSNELFDGNLDLYRETIRTINKMNELDEALSFLESNFQFDQDKKSFKSFIEMIYRRFL